MKNKILFSTLILVALIVTACGSATPAAPATTVPNVPITGSSTDTTASGLGVGGPAVVNVGSDANLGSFLVDSKGMTLYLFTKDTPNTSNCYNGCASAWPPLLTLGAPTSGTGVDDSLLGTTTRTDGSVQVTYNGWPLYYFANDKAVGDVTGEGVQGVWFVVTPDGKQK
jgi:predicted lipoprotein with Yx(FWY)xxD motif